MSETLYLKLGAVKCINFVLPFIRKLYLKKKTLNEVLKNAAKSNLIILSQLAVTTASMNLTVQGKIGIQNGVSKMVNLQCLQILAF